MERKDNEANKKDEEMRRRRGRRRMGGREGEKEARNAAIKGSVRV